MKHSILRISILAILIFVIQSTPAHAQGYLRAKGKDIVDGRGKPYILRGMGLGGWLLQEGYMFKLGFLGQQYRIREKIEDVVGVEKTKEFYQKWLATHTTRADVDSMAAWGFNSIRLPMHYALYTLPVHEEPVAGKNTWLQKGFALTDSLLAWCKANRMYLILDLHAAPGGQGNDLPISDRDAARPSLWESKPNQEKMIALWRKLAERYANEPWIGGYDIINEPNWGFEDARDVRGTAEQKNIPLRELMMQVTHAIREVDKNHIIIIEGNGFGNNYRGIFPAWDDNLVMSFHKYGNFNTTAAIQNFLDIRDKQNIPLWLGESGENSNTWFTECISLVEKNGIGWAWWQEKKMNINNPLEIIVPGGYQLLLDYWSGKGIKPSQPDAWRILEELLHNIAIGNNIHHRDVTDAMFRQVKTNGTIPFVKTVIGSTPVIIKAVDFDLGKQGFAYFDKDTASYQYTPGVNTRGNRGYAYRNDGVDIRNAEQEYYIFHTEAGEWMQYTVHVTMPGKYNFSMEAMADSVAGSVSLLAAGKTLISAMNIPATPAQKKWQWVKASSVILSKGDHQFRVLINKGGFNLKSIKVARQK